MTSDDQFFFDYVCSPSPSTHSQSGADKYLALLHPTQRPKILPPSRRVHRPTSRQCGNGSPRYSLAAVLAAFVRPSVTTDSGPAAPVAAVNAARARLVRAESSVECGSVGVYRDGMRPVLWE